MFTIRNLLVTYLYLFAIVFPFSFSITHNSIEFDIL